MTMESADLEGQEQARNEHAASPSLDNSAEFTEDDHSDFSVFDAKLEFEKIMRKIPLYLEIKQPKLHRRCRQIQRSLPCSNSQNHLTGTNKNLAPSFFADLEEISCESHVILYGNKSLLNIPASMTASGYILKTSKLMDITRNINNLSKFFPECSPFVQSGNIVMSPSARWVHDFTQGNVKGSGPIKSSLSFDPVKQDVHMKQIISRLAGNMEMKFSDSSSFPRICSPLLENAKPLAEPPWKQSSDAKFSQELMFSCSSPESTSSYQSTSPAHGCVSSALLHCVWESDIRYFLFTMDADDGGKVYAASPLKIKPSVDKSLDYIYLFHSWKAIGNESKKNVISASPVVGKMKVSSSVIVNSNRSKFIETEFVLFGANEKHSAENKSSSNPKKKNMHFRKMAVIFRPSHSSKHSPKIKVGITGSGFGDLCQFFSGEQQIIDEPDCSEHLLNDFLPNRELAAIVVRDYGCNVSKGVAFGGWGLKFLEKVELDDVDSSREPPSSSSESCKERFICDRETIARNVTVLVPAGFHGGSFTRAGGPSSLTDRWKSGGQCDCGGWDIGCPIKVLNNNSICSLVLPKAKVEGNFKSFELFTEDVKHSEPTLKVLNVSKDMYAVKSGSTLSALQSFAIAVAMIHSQTPDLYPNL
ncbi:unnamed protein product [Musa acuminata var. zebrina]